MMQSLTLLKPTSLGQAIAMHGAESEPRSHDYQREGEQPRDDVARHVA